MKLDEALLQRLADWRPGDRQSVTAADEAAGWAITLTADRCDEIGCRVWEVSVRRTAAAPEASPEALRAWADRIAGRVTGLLEPLHLVELDAARNEALLRSVEPTRRGDDAFYSEVLLHGAQAAELRRYRAARPDAHREQIAFALTHEALAKVARDLTAEA